MRTVITKFCCCRSTVEYFPFLYIIVDILSSMYISYINTCAGAKRTKEIMCNPYWSLEIQNLFGTTYFSLYCFTSFRRLWYVTMQHIHLLCNKTGFSPFPWKPLPVVPDCCGITFPFIVLLPTLALKDISEKLPVQKTLLWLLKCKELC